VPGLRDRLTDAGYGLGWSVACRLPESWAQRGFRLVADCAWRCRGPGVQVLEGNLRRVIGSQAPGGELRTLSRQAMRSYARYWLEAFRLPVIPLHRPVPLRHTPTLSNPASSRTPTRRKSATARMPARIEQLLYAGTGLVL
jgi:lauroyl/myristoyl acyltransferase